MARSLQSQGSHRDRLTRGIYLPTDRSESLGRLERAFGLALQAEPILKAIKAASRDGRLPKGRPAQLIEEAEVRGIVSPEQAWLLKEAEEARYDAVQVDAFELGVYRTLGGRQSHNASQSSPIGVGG